MSSTQNGTTNTQEHTIDSDIALLTSLLSGANSDGIDESDLDGPEVQELLKRLEAADGVAQGVESRLDEIIGNLDGLLGSLEQGAGGEGSAEVKGSDAPEDKSGEK